jgi:hypothetical protein
MVASPEPATGVSTPAGTCPGRLRRHCMIGCADPGQNPSAVRFGSSRVRGRGLGSAMVRSVPRCRAGSGDNGRGFGRGRGPTRRATRPCCSTAAWRVRTRCRAPRDSSLARAPMVGKLQMNSLFCKPICKPDAARQYETGETDPTGRDGIRPVCRGHHARERLPETSETHIVWLITQRSRVQIPPPLLVSAGQGPFPAGRGPLA